MLPIVQSLPEDGINGMKVCKPDDPVMRRGISIF